jgi:hypothetical protein
MNRGRAYDVSPYRFLIDRSTAKAGALFPDPRRRVLYLHDVGLAENAPDSAIVERASEFQSIIVTANGRDFVQAIDTFQQKQMRDQCHDLYGLIILPNHYATQERSIPKLGDRLRFEGSSATWADVQINNLSVRLTDEGEVRVTALSRCRYCFEYDPKRPMKKD